MTRPRAFSRVWGLVAAVLVTLAVVALTTPAADAARSSRCASAGSPTLARPLKTSAGRLLLSDGTGFFPPDLTQVYLQAADPLQPDIVAATAGVRDVIAEHYGDDLAIRARPHGSEAIGASPGSESDEDISRLVVIDGDVSVPGEPSVYAIDGKRTLYLHWTTAADDARRLLDVPEFAAVALDAEPGTADTASCGVDGPAEPSSSLGESVDDLRFADEGLPSLPLGDASTGERSPLPLAVVAVALAAGGVIAHRRDDIFGSPTTASVPSPTPTITIDSDPDVRQTPLHETGPARRRVIDLHGHRSESELARSVERAAAREPGALLTRDSFANLINSEWSRRQRGGHDGAVASLVLSELDAVRLRLGAHAAQQLLNDVLAKMLSKLRSLDMVAQVAPSEFALLMPELDADEARETLDRLTRAVAATTFVVGAERVLLTPASGFAMLSDTPTAPDIVHAIEHARAKSMLSLHLDPERWDGEPESEAGARQPGRIRTTLKAKLHTPLQVLATFVIAWVLPFLTYLALDAVGIDVSFVVYLIVVSALVVTGAFILTEGFMAIRQAEPPEQPTAPFPKATALIAAYLPNEAATVIETIEAFLALDYPNEVQIILAYNTPKPLPVEDHLERLAAKHPNFVPVRVVGSNSKAQNVNAALSMATGAFIGMFDADHQPRPDAFTRAWRWIDAGYDVVQGHCLTRNGDAGFLAKMIAVEFESIYAVAHPGRAKMHRFGVFGGSNGFWRTELLHETRMRGSMLTEDIDSSMRVIERGFKIRSDRDLVSRELATTTLKQVWNQRLRWAQGWFQVSIEHVKLGFRSKELSIRQKFGLFHLLLWREIYPWLSQQLFPLLAFWAVRAGGIEKLDWTVPIFLATTIFTFSVGPLQTVFAYKLADPEIKQHTSWFWMYLLFTSPFYTEFKNLISRVAHIKQFMGESSWRVTPRSADPAPASATPAA